MLQEVTAVVDHRPVHCQVVKHFLGDKPEEGETRERELPAAEAMVPDPGQWYLTVGVGSCRATGPGDTAVNHLIFGELPRSSQEVRMPRFPAPLALNQIRFEHLKQPKR